MKNHGRYTHVTLSGHDFLMPYGQAAADHKHSFEVNENTLWIFDHLDSERNAQSLYQSYVAHFHYENEDQNEVYRDFWSVLKTFQEAGILSFQKKAEKKPSLCVQIAGIGISFYGDASLIEKPIQSFQNSRTDTAIEISLIQGLPNVHNQAVEIVHNKEITILEAENSWIIRYPLCESIHEGYIAKDGTKAFLYYHNAGKQKTSDLVVHISYFIRTVFLLYAEIHDFYMIHSVSILYQNKAWLFSASSGTGKSTHARLWKKAFGVEQLNGDLNLVGFENGSPLIYGIPWCGTSGIYTKKEIPLGGIVFLKRDIHNHVKSLSMIHQILSIQARLISPSWNAEMLQRNIGFSEKLAPIIYTAELFCNMDEEAAVVCKKAIDHYLSEREK